MPMIHKIVCIANYASFCSRFPKACMIKVDNYLPVRFNFIFFKTFEKYIVH